MRVLIVDDYPPKLHILEHIVRRLRPDVDLTVAESFVEGRAALVEAEWDCALFDNRLHDGSGMSLLRLARDRGIPALVVSAHEPSTQEERREVRDLRDLAGLRRTISGAFGWPS